MKLIQLINKALERKARKKLRKRSYFYISEAGKKPYEIFKAMMRYGYLSPRQQRVYDNGKQVHERLLSYLEKQGVVKAREVKIESRIFRGRADAILSLDEKLAVLEIKSMNKKSFKQLKHYADKQAYLQLQLYLHFLEIDDGILLIECKDDQKLKEFHIKRKPRTARQLITQFYSLKEKFVEAGVMEE